MTPTPGAPSPPPASFAAGILFTLFAGFTFATLDSLGKYAMTMLPAMQVLWARYAVHTAISTGYLASRSGTRFLRTRRPLLQVTRGMCLLTASVSVWIALQYVPVGDVTALIFFSPVVVTILSVVVLKEKIGIHRIMAIIVALLGVILIVEPGSQGINPYHLLVLFGASSNAVFLLLTRALAGQEESAATLFHTTALGTVILSVLAAFSWQTPDMQTALVLLTLGVLAAIGHSSLQRGFSHAPASLLAPFLYSQILFATLYGVLWFGDALRPAMLAGTLLIVSSGIYIWWRERKRSL